MIVCDDQACRIEWFHAECLHMKNIPKVNGSAQIAGRKGRKSTNHDYLLLFFVATCHEIIIYHHNHSCYL